MQRLHSGDLKRPFDHGPVGRIPACRPAFRNVFSSFFFQVSPFERPLRCNGYVFGTRKRPFNNRPMGGILASPCFLFRIKHNKVISSVISSVGVILKRSKRVDQGFRLRESIILYVEGTGACAGMHRPQGVHCITGWACGFLDLI